MTPVALFGLSGVGKTTLAHGLTNLDHQTFFIASITTSRSPRADDDPRYIEFLSEIDFISCIAQNCRTNDRCNRSPNYRPFTYRIRLESVASQKISMEKFN